MDKNSNLSEGLKKVTVSSMTTYLRGMSAEKIENIIKWAKASKNPNANINTTNPSEWEKQLKTMFSQLTSQDQNEVVLQATKILNEKKAR